MCLGLPPEVQVSTAACFGDAFSIGFMNMLLLYELGWLYSLLRWRILVLQCLFWCVHLLGLVLYQQLIGREDLLKQPGKL